MSILEHIQQENTKGRYCQSILLYTFHPVNLMCTQEPLRSVINRGVLKKKFIIPIFKTWRHLLKNVPCQMCKKPIVNA